MSGTKRKTKKTMPSTKSSLKKQKRPLTTHSTSKGSTEAKTTKGKRGTLHLEKADRKNTSSSFSVKGREAKQRKSSGSSPREGKRQRNEEHMKKPSVPSRKELSLQEILDLKPVPRDKIARSKRARVFQVTEQGRVEVPREVFEQRAGRPKKSDDLKEKNHVVRFSDRFLALLKKRAKKEGYEGWQTFLKVLVAKEIGFQEFN